MAADLSLFDSLYRAVCAFEVQMEFCTEPTSDGGRRVVGICGAECVSNAADTLHTRLAFVNARIATSGIGNDAVLIKTLCDAEAALASARGDSACRETDSVVEMLQRYRDGDLLGSSLLEALDAARQQLEPYAQQGKAKWSDLSTGERDGTCVDRSGERRSLCKAVEGLVSRSREWVFARVREFAELSPTDRHTDPTFDSPAARAVAVFRLLEVANAGGVLVSDLLPEGVAFGAPAWVPGDDPADAARYLAKCAAWMRLVGAAEKEAKELGGGGNGNAKHPACPAVVALTADHDAILTVLGKTPSKCKTVIDVSSAATIRNRETVGRLLGELAGFGLVDRPHGRRKGYALTDAGRKRLPGATAT